MDVKNFNDAGVFLLGNEALSLGALSAGVQYASGYPGTPSSEVLETLSKRIQGDNLYVEWSCNEKVAAEGAAAAAIAGQRSLVAMKNAGLSVALDFLVHLSLSGLGGQKGAMAVLVCDDPDGHSSGDETDSRWIARFASAPLLEPSSVQEAYEMMRWAYEISEKHDCYVMVRGYTRLCHSSCALQADINLDAKPRFAHFDTSRALSPYIAKTKHSKTLEKLSLIKEKFEFSSFNNFRGPETPELTIVCSGSGFNCATEAVQILGLEDTVGILKIGTLWPFPQDKVAELLQNTSRILIAEEVDPFIETLVKETIVEKHLPIKECFGKGSDHIPMHGEITPDAVLTALKKILRIDHEKRSADYQAQLDCLTEKLLINRGLTWCPGCPHRASFWALGQAIKTCGDDVYVTGDIGCYTLDVFPEGKEQMNVLHAMGSGTGLASGAGILNQKGNEQPVVAVCGDSTFFHASIPALINAVHNGSRMIQIVLDNSATAMTGFQPHPGTDVTVDGRAAQPIDIQNLCESIGCKVTTMDPFDLRATRRTIRSILKEESGVNVILLKRRCELLRSKTEKTQPFDVNVITETCRGEECGICSREFRCPALVLDPDTGKAQVLTSICTGCGVCADVCPFDAISREARIK